MQAMRKPVMEEVVQLRLLGPMTLARGEDGIALPKSRKVRALLAYLALSPRPVTRSHLCELLWDSPSDPRSELRWCLSRIRSVIDTPSRSRIQTQGESVALQMDPDEVDALAIVAALERGSLDTLDVERLRSLTALFTGELLDGLQVDDSPLFEQWLVAERRRLRTARVTILTALVGRLPLESDEALAALDQWLKVDAFDRRAHELLLEALVRNGRMREAEDHLNTAIRAFELEGLEWISIREAWRAARNRERPAEIRMEEAPAKPLAAAPTAAAASGRASICVLPFLELDGEHRRRSSVGDGLADDIITRLAKMRVLFVIARGTAFSLVDRNTDAEEAGRILGVDYIASGSVRRREGRIVVKAELIETASARIVWSDELECAADGALQGVDAIGNGIVASIAEEVEAAERNRAVLKAPNSLNAWEAYHRGLWHIYRFNSADNDRAEHFFRMSAELDPTFARAHAGLSFAHFQNAFLLRPSERAVQIGHAYEAAGRSLMADDRDPSAHWAMGRALWLQGDESGSLAEVTTSVELSPNFALGHYTLGFLHSQSGDPQQAIDAVDHSRLLSPFDPMLYAMLATRAIGHARLGHYADAATWALKAAARPNAHAHIGVIAALCLALAGRGDEARAFLARVRAARPDYSMSDFTGAFRFDRDTQRLFERAANLVGFA